MLASNIERKFARDISALLHAEKLKEAALGVIEACEFEDVRVSDDSPGRCLPILQHYLHYLLNAGGIEEAAQLLWTKNQFTPEPQFTRDIWQLFDESSMGLIMGAASCTKSYSMGVRLFLEYIRDPEWTAIKVIGPSEDHLEQNLFSGLVRLFNTSALPMPGAIGELFIGTDRRNQTGSIRGLVIPIGQKKKAGRLQGGKRVPRPAPHPIFGSQSRLFIFLDEIENIPGGIWTDIDNILSNTSAEGTYSGFKIFGAYNPTNQNDEVAKRAEPPFGWPDFNVDEHFKWKSLRGWDVLRLDGEKSENVVQGKEVYPGLQTREGLDKMARNSGGRESAGYYSMGRGAYPPQGIVLAIVPPGMLSRIKGEFIWYDDPQPVGSCDLALEGGAAAVFTTGKWGKATGIRYPASLDFPQGRTVMFKDRNNQVFPRYALQVEQQFVVPKGETVAMKTRLIELCRKAGIKPEYFACDRTGHGAGVADLMKHDWSHQIHAVNYSEGCSETKIMIEDQLTCKEQYVRMDSELWFAFRAYAEFAYLLLSPSLDMTNLSPQVTQRKFISTGKKTRVESKTDFMSRGFSSPDEADSLMLIVHAVRKGSGLVLTMKGDESIDLPGDDEGWYDGATPRGIIIDSTNKTEWLDESGDEIPML